MKMKKENRCTRKNCSQCNSC